MGTGGGEGGQQKGMAGIGFSPTIITIVPLYQISS